MKNRLNLTLVLLSLFAMVQAQQKPPSKPAFRSIEQFAMINGDEAVSAGIQSVNGVVFKGWFAGLGVGLDFYRYRTAPLFIDLRKEISLKRNKIFAYADGGYNLPWIKKEDVYRDWPNWGFYKEENKYKGGLYVDAGLGYAIGFKSGNALLLSAGYSKKQFKATKTITNKSAVGTPQESQQIDVQQFSYRFSRLMLKIGWQF